MTTNRSPLPSALALLAAVLLCRVAPTLEAASLEVQVKDRTGAAVEHAMISLHDGTSRHAPEGTHAVMDQRARQFAPTVVPLQTGTVVSFPNSDDVRHHVYSFSYPNSFELKLYHGETSEPIRFDEPGIVVLGCNIHDGMIGYLHVVDTPLFAGSAASGVARIDDAPPGDYTFRLWHPDLGTSYLRRPLALGSGTTRLVVTMDRQGIEDAVLGAAGPEAPSTDRPASGPTVPATDDAARGRELESLFRD